jgi:GMP synthase-like glutamine amidotransferase
MPILVLRHEPFEHLGSFGAVLEENKIPFVYHDLGEPLSLEGSSGVILMGGPMSANDPLPGLSDELKLIEQALRADVPVLGICLGAQLIAKALGARVYRNPQREIGWEPVHFTPAAFSDRLFSGLPSPMTFFHWHGETFDLPAGAEWLAWSEKCRHQAYRFGRSAYGIQFHPEITPEMIEDWCAQPANCGDVAALETPIDPHAADSRPQARHILEGWLSLLTPRSVSG